MSERNAPAISVIVPHYQDLVSLEQCLAALTRQTIGSDGFEIVVADNMSPVGEAAVIAAVAGRARVVIATERGAGPARNAGVAAARGGTLAFTDCDCVPEPSWLAEGVAALEQFDVVGGAMTVLVDDRRLKTGAEAFECVFAFDNRAYVERKGFTVTANLFCRRDVFDAVGGFGTGVSEDLEWCHRATSQGYRLGYAARAVVGHPARRDWIELRGKWRRLNAETYALHRARSGGALQWLVRSWALPLSILVHVPVVMRSRALRGPIERWRALRTLIRLRLWRFVDAHRLMFGVRR